MKKKSAGRPKLGTQDAKRVVFSARFTPPEAKAIRAAIATSRSSKSEWMRKAVLSAAQDGRPST